MLLRRAATILCVAAVVGCRSPCEEETKTGPSPEDSGTLVTLRGVVALDADLAIAVGDDGTILRRSDDGLWVARPSIVNEPLFAIDAPLRRIHGELVIAVGASGTIVRSADTGETWQPHASGTDADLYAVSFGATGHVVAVGDGVILHSGDNGKTWASAGPSQEIGVLHAVRANNVDDAASEFVAVGDAGQVWYSPEHGIDWLELSSGTREDLRGVGEDPSYPTPMNFVIVGDHGTVRRMSESSIDGSLYFAAVSDATTADITHISRDSDWVLSDDGFTISSKAPKLKRGPHAAARATGEPMARETGGRPPLHARRAPPARSIAAVVTRS